MVPADGDLDVEFDLLALSRVNLMTAAEAALRVARGRGRRTARTGPGASASTSACDDPAANPARDLFAAAASFALAIAGLILPGIPSIPFLLLAVDCLSRGYPPLRPRLLSLPGIGDRLRSPTGRKACGSTRISSAKPWSSASWSPHCAWSSIRRFRSFWLVSSARFS